MKGDQHAAPASLAREIELLNVYFNNSPGRQIPQARQRQLRKDGGGMKNKHVLRLLTRRILVTMESN